MLILAARIQETRQSIKHDSFTIRCNCGCTGRINVYAKRGKFIRLGFDFPQETTVLRNSAEEQPDQEPELAEALNGKHDLQ